MVTKNYRLRIVTDGKEFEAEGDKPFVLQMAKLYGPTQLAVTSSTKSAQKDSPRPSQEHSSGKSLAIREFVQQLGLKKHTDISLAFGYYLEKHRGRSDFTAADVNNCYYEAKLESSNTSQMFINNIKRGYLMPSKQKGEKGKNRYTLTGSGEQFIDSKMNRATK